MVSSIERLDIVALLDLRDVIFIDHSVFQRVLAI